MQQLALVNARLQPCPGAFATRECHQTLNPKRPLARPATHPHVSLTTFPLCDAQVAGGYPSACQSIHIPTLPRTRTAPLDARRRSPDCLWPFLPCPENVHLTPHLCISSSTSPPLVPPAHPSVSIHAGSVGHFHVPYCARQFGLNILFTLVRLAHPAPHSSMLISQVRSPMPHCAC
jgi:hypothetical protein